MIEVSVWPVACLKMAVDYGAKFDLAVTTLDPSSYGINNSKQLGFDFPTIQSWFYDIHFVDAPFSPNIEQIENILTSVKPYLEDGNKRIAVACMAGKSRSSAVALSILTMKHNNNISKAINEMRDMPRRNEFLPNRLIIEYTDTLLKLNGKLERCVDNNFYYGMGKRGYA